MVGYLTDEQPAQKRIVTFSKKSDEWFYLHVEKKLKIQNLEPDSIPIRDYLFRYYRGAFWAGKYVFQELRLPFTKFTRSLLDSYMNTDSLYNALRVTNRSQSVICQDFCLPSERAREFLEYLERTLKLYPLWVIPLKASSSGDRFSPVHLSAPDVVNVGVYAKFNGTYEDFVQANKALEKKLTELGARKVLYAHQYYSREGFWQVYDREWYQALRIRYHAENVFPDIYESTHVGKKYQPRPGRVFSHLLKKLVARQR